MNYEFKHIIFLGDSHGIDNIRLPYVPEGSLVIHVGDVGLGFYHPIKERRLLVRLNDYLVEKNITLWAIRGNHDDPAIWHEEEGRATGLSNIELIKDYTSRTVNNEQYLFVGGAISVDRRALDNQGRRIRAQGRDWWRDEEVVQVDLETLNKHDVVVAHTGPPDLGPPSNNGHMQYYAKTDPTLIEELTKERQFIQDLLNKTEPRLFVCGHFHMSCRLLDRERNKHYRILDIGELWSEN